MTKPVAGRGAGEAVFLGDRDEVLEVAQLHFMLQVDDSHESSSLDSITITRESERRGSGAWPPASCVTRGSIS
jgi:hypothetical protein